MLLGIDTGGTYTDAVLFTEEEGVLRTAKSLTTKHDLSIGICKAVDAILAEGGEQIRMVSLSTTLATNAIVEAHGSPVCLIMIGYDKGALERSKLGEAIGANPHVFIDGGHRSMGEEQAPLDLEAARKAIEEYGPKVAAFAVAGYFSVRNPEHEIAVRSMIREMTGLPVTCAHELTSGLDAPRRALTAVLNARLIPQIQQLIHAVGVMLEQKNIKAPLMVVKGDGSLISAETALTRPVETILSGPAASVVGAHYLSGEQDVFVVDMGGTTTDIALLHDGEPVLNDQGALVGGWRTMVEAVSVHTFGLGGDSEVLLDRQRTLTVGPRRIQPISLLAEQYPEVLAELDRQLRDERIREHDGRFALRLRRLDTSAESLSRMEAEIWEMLAEGPVPLNDLLMKPAMARPLERLIDRGLVIRSGLTPSDASHLLGRHGSWNRGGAEKAAQLQIRLGVRDGILPKVTPEELGAMIYERVVTRSGETILQSAFHEEGLPAIEENQTLGNSLIANALRDRGKEARAPLLDFVLNLGRPLVAIGAPAATYYPDVARRMNVRLCVPDHAEVSNAVGAVAGGVMQNVRLLITSPDKGRFRVHTAEGIKDFLKLEEAADYACALASDEVLALARSCGARDIEVKIDRKDKVAIDAGGDEVFIESRVTATAHGRPVLATDE